jgi:hypothetical protein
MDGRYSIHEANHTSIWSKYFKVTDLVSTRCRLRFKDNIKSDAVETGSELMAQGSNGGVWRRGDELSGSVQLKLSLCLNKHHAMNTYGRMEV